MPLMTPHGIMMRLTVGAALLAVCMGACSSGRTRPSVGHVVGTIREIGGPHPGVNVAIPGTVAAVDATGHHFRAASTSAGSFRLTLPPGDYSLTATSPKIRGGGHDNHPPCSDPTRIHIRGGRTAHKNLECHIP